MVKIALLIAGLALGAGLTKIIELNRNKGRISKIEILEVQLEREQMFKYNPQFLTRCREENGILLDKLETLNRIFYYELQNERE